MCSGMIACACGNGQSVSNWSAECQYVCAQLDEQIISGMTEIVLHGFRATWFGKLSYSSVTLQHVHYCKSVCERKRRPERDWDRNKELLALKTAFCVGLTEWNAHQHHCNQHDTSNDITWLLRRLLETHFKCYSRVLFFSDYFEHHTHQLDFICMHMSFMFNWLTCFTFHALYISCLTAQLVILFLFFRRWWPLSINN